MTICSRSFAVACVLVAMLVSATPLAAGRIDKPSIRVRVDDYASVSVDLLSRAQDEVKQLYAGIGVETNWLETRHMSKRRADAALARGANAADLTVMVLSPSMTTRMAPPEDVLGLAAATPTEHGRIAYVFYDRLQISARRSDASNVAALAFVMAHEIGHLLLPYGSHSDSGVMRGHWDQRTFHRLEIQRLRFTPLQARQIRRLLELAW